ncbi:MAG: hypothetical protein QXY15_11065 [Candidatus Nitrosotenuis sp.]
MPNKRPKWRIVRELEESLRILKRGRREFRLVLISMLQDALELVENGEEPMLVARSVRDRGKHRYSTVHSLFTELSTYSPQLLKPHNNFDDGKIGRFTPSFFDVLGHDLGIWNELDRTGEISELDRSSVQKLGELLDRFHNVTGIVKSING